MSFINQAKAHHYGGFTWKDKRSGERRLLPSKRPLCKAKTVFPIVTSKVDAVDCKACLRKLERIGPQ